MKKFSRILAMVLALITVLAALPMSVIADSWLDVETEALPGGDGSKVTVTLDAKALAEILKDDGLSKDTLEAILENAALDSDAFFEAFSPEELYQIVPRENILEVLGKEDMADLLGDREIFELLLQQGMNGNFQPILLLFYNYGMKNIDKLVLNGHVVAEQDYTDLLKVDAAELLLALDAMIPTLDELAELDSNVLTSLDLQMEYLPEDGVDTVSKHIVFEFALAGGSEQIAAAATKLRDLISDYVNALDVSLENIDIDVIVPDKFGQGYLSLLQSDKISDEIKQKIIAVPDMSGDEMVAFINEELTIDEICEILSAIEPSEVFEKAKNSAFVEAILAKLGKTAPDVTLDEVWATLNEKEITITKVCDAIEKATQRDVMALLQAGAPQVDGFMNKAEEIAQINALLAKVESKLGIDVSDISVEDILNRNADANLLDKIAEVVSAKVGVDIRAIMANYTPDELWAKALEKAAEREDIYKKVRNYLLLALDRLPDNVMALSIADFYQGNGQFAAQKLVQIETKPVVEKLLTKLADGVKDPQVQDAIELLMTRFEDSVLSVDTSIKVRFNNLFRINFMDRVGGVNLFSAFLPVGTDLSIYKHNPDLTGIEFNGWEDENGVEIATMPAYDITVYAIADTITLTFTDALGTVYSTMEVPKGFNFNIAGYADLLRALNADVVQYAPANDSHVYTPWRVLWTVGTDVIDLDREIGLDLVFNEDTTLLVDFSREYLLYFLDPSVDYDVTYDSGLYTVTVHDDFAEEYVLNLKALLPLAKLDDSIALKLVIEKENIVLADIKNATLKELNLSTESDNCVWFKFAKNAAVTDAFAGTFYEGKNLPSYSFSFIASEKNDALNERVVTVGMGGEIITIQLPYANAVVGSNYMTRVYTVASGKRAYLTTSVAADGVVTFETTGLSDIVISDEYRLELSFTPAGSGSLKGGYEDADGKLYFPAGAQFDLFFNIASNYAVSGILDSMGTDYALGDTFTMPAANEVLTVMVIVDIDDTVTLYFKDAQGGYLTFLEIPKGSTLAHHLPFLQSLNSALLANSPAISGDDAKLFGSWRVLWKFGAGSKVDVDNAIGLNLPFYTDTTLVCDWAKNYFLYFSNPSINYDVTYDNGLYTVLVHTGFASEYNLNIKDLLPKADADSTVALKLVIEQKDIVLADIKNETLKSLHEATATDPCVWFRYKKNTAVTDTFDGTFYEGKILPCYSFAFLATATSSLNNARVVTVDFGGKTVKIQLPYADTANTAEYMTRVYTAANGARQYLTTVVVKDGVIQFATESFSDVIISNEYLLNVEFMPAIQGALLGGYADASGKLYFPAGAEFALNFEIADGYLFDKAVDSASNEYAEGDVFTMPAAAETLTVYTHFTDSKQFHIYYYYIDPVTGELKKAADTYSYYTEAFDADLALNPNNVSADALKAVLPGYNKNEYRWSELDQSLVGVSDISLFMIRIPITYTVRFVNAKDGALISTLEGLTAENADLLYKLPDALEGMIGGWTVMSIEKPADLTDPAQNVITIVLSGTMASNRYEIEHGPYVTDETPYFAEAGETVTVKVEDRYGYIAEIIVKTTAGETVEVTNGSFTMPASSVVVTANYKPVTIPYKINKVPGVGNYMDSIPVVITLKRGETLASISEECVLVSTVQDGDKTILTYEFVLDSEKTITYKIARAKSVIDRIFNGTLFNDAFFPIMEGDVDFEIWSEPLFNALSFAMFSLPEEECSPVWCWIAIILLILILAIVVLYILSIKGIVVPFLTFLATHVVGAFFWLCILLARFGKKIVSLFKKK